VDGWLKGLIAAACLAVIAAVGFYFWQQYRLGISQAEYAKEAKIRSGCIAAIGNNSLPALKQYCVEKGYLTEEQASR
jgi:hypothetical protein